MECKREKSIEVKIDKALRERSFGRLEGIHTSEIIKLVGELILIPNTKKKQLHLHDIETDEEILDRFVPFINKIAAQNRGENILFITHGGVMRPLLKFLGYQMPDWSKKPMKNAGYLIIESDGVDFFVREENLF